MITIGFSTRKKNDDFKNHIRDTVGLKNVEIIEVINDGDKSLTTVYNEIIMNSNFDIVVLCHDDIFFNTKSWGFKLLKHFEKSDYGILGVAGTRFLANSGVWWEDRNKMMGIVKHKQNDKEWESRYSPSLGGEVEKSIIVDGLFISLNKLKIKKNFDEYFDGFHFYDLSFCLENFLSDVNIGVLYNINITHNSIGITNEKWEENRIKFISKFKDVLPLKLPFNRKRKVKVLISLLSYKNLTGSELYVYELSKELIKNNFDVSILSNIGNPLKQMSEKIGIKHFNLENPPGYKMGDGKWGLNTEEGFRVSESNRLYKINEVNFDIILTQHKPISEFVCKLYPKIPKISTIHSEIINLEEPILDDSIKHYIAIRETIKDYILEKIDIPSDVISVIPNPIDYRKYNLNNIKLGDYYLFVGTIDYLRIYAIKDIIDKAEKEKRNVLLIGEDKNDYLRDIIKPNVKHINPIWSGLEKYVKECYKVVGIKLGRTTIEGWMCGKESIIYDVDQSGNILKTETFKPPFKIDIYDSRNVVSEISKIIYEII